MSKPNGAVLDVKPADVGQVTPQQSDASLKQEMELAELEKQRLAQIKTLTVTAAYDDTTAESGKVREMFDGIVAGVEVTEATLRELGNLTMDAKSVRAYFDVLCERYEQANTDSKRFTLLRNRVSEVVSLYQVYKIFAAQKIDCRTFDKSRTLLYSGLIHGTKLSALGNTFQIPACGVPSAEVSKRFMSEKKADNAVVYFRQWLLSCDVKTDNIASVKIKTAAVLKRYVDDFREQIQVNARIQSMKKKEYAKANSR